MEAEVETRGPEAVPEKPLPFWKKEISLGRQRKDEPLAEEAPHVEGEQPRTDESKPFWKKELSFGRRRKAEPLESDVAADDDEGWNRDLIFRSAEPEPVPEPEPLPEPVFFELPPEAEGDADEGGADEVPEPELEPEPEPPAVEHAWATPAVSPSVSSAYGWVTDDLEAADLASTSWAGTAPPLPVVRDLPQPDPEPEPAAAEVDVEPADEAEPEPEPREPATVVHPPVTDGELPPLPEDDAGKKPSFLRRELSFRRRAKEDAAAGDEETAVEPEPEASAEDGATPLERERPFRRHRRRRDDGAAGEEAAAPKPPRGSRRGKAAGGGRHKKLVGLKIGASQLAAARIHNNGSAQLLQLARHELDAGVVVGGEPRDTEALAQALKDFFKKHKLPRSAVRLGIANNRIGVRTFDLAGIEDPKQLANAIRFRAQEALPIPIEEAVLDYRVLAETTDEEGAVSRRILLVVAYRDLVDRYVEACRRAGIKLVGIDLEAFALLRALSAPPEDDEWVAEAATVAVAIGHERSTFAVSDGRVCEFTRVLEWGGSSLNVAIARTLDLAPSEAEPIKRELSLAAETEIPGLDADQVLQAREAVLRQVQSFARELVSSLQFYQGQPGSLGIAEIAVTGGTAHLPGLAAELERLIGVRVRLADPLARVRVGKKVGDEEQIGSLAVAIGLGIDD